VIIGYLIPAGSGYRYTEIDIEPPEATSRRRRPRGLC
jgi:hypothetical protein